MMSERRSGPRATSALVGVAVALASPAIRQRRPARAGVAVVSLALGVMLSGCALGTSSHASASRAQPAVLVDAHATCPKDPTQVQIVSEVCRRTKFGNAVTPIFKIPGTQGTPAGPWGIAWSYRCAGPSDFYVVVHMEGLDGIMPLTAVFRHGLRERGYKMETTRWQDSWQSADPHYRIPQNLALDTTCAWHVRVVRGNASTVAAHVPAIP